jgi:hypothetical protein
VATPPLPEGRGGIAIPLAGNGPENPCDLSLTFLHTLQTEMNLFPKVKWASGECHDDRYLVALVTESYLECLHPIDERSPI